GLGNRPAGCCAPTANDEVGVRDRAPAGARHQADPGQLGRRGLGAGGRGARAQPRAARRVPETAQGMRDASAPTAASTARAASRSQRSAREGGHEMSESPEARLAALGLALPPVPAPLAAYAPAVRTGRYVYTAGQLPMLDGKLLLTGKVGAQVTVAEAAALARTAALNAPAPL